MRSVIAKTLEEVPIRELEVASHKVSGSKSEENWLS